MTDMLKASESKPEDNAPPQYYQPQEIPGLTRFLVKCHPQAKKICEELDKFFDQYCLWRNERERELFLMIEPHMWGCMAFPLASNDRVLHIVKASSLLFLIDDLLEDMSVEEGKTFAARLTPLIKDKRLPDKSDPLEWIVYDTFASMRECSSKLTDEVIEGLMEYMGAQLNEARLKETDMGSWLQQRSKEGGAAFVAAMVRFGMDLNISTDVLDSLQEIYDSFAKLTLIINDIQSFDKELHALQTHGKEGAHMFNIVKMMARDGGVSIAAAKRICYVLVRESELEHERLVAKRKAEPDGGDESLNKYLYALGCVIGGNEAWSQTTARYHQKW